MSGSYSNIVLTAIALFLGAIVAKRYLPAAQQIGVQTATPSRGDVVAAMKITDPDVRRARKEELRAHMPAVWIDEGKVDVSGSDVTVNGEVTIAGSRE